MRLILALSLIFALAACSTPATSRGAAPASTGPRPTPTPETQSSHTEQEAAYLAALRDALDYEDYDTLDEDLYLEQGHEICGWQPSHQDVIDNMASDGPVYEAALTKLCPEHRKVWRQSKGGFTDGNHTVGDDIKPGTYRTVNNPVTECYWERSAGGGGIIANDFITNAPGGVTVTVHAGEGFTSNGCGPWIRK